MIRAALAYARRGWHVFPIAGKRPLTEHGHLDATTDTTTVRQWWSDSPEAWVAVHLRASGLVCVDVDGEAGLAQLARLEAELGPLPRDLVAISGTRRTPHIFMADPSPGPDGWTRRQEDGGRARGKLAPSVDLKINGYVVLAPSGAYEWQYGRLINICDGTRLVEQRIYAPPVPAAWLPEMRHDDAVPQDGAGTDAWQESAGAWTDQLAGILRARLATVRRQQGTPDPTLLAVRLVFHDFGRSVADGWPFLEEWSDGCGKPYPHRELARQLERCARKVTASEPDAPRGHMCLGLYEQAAIAELARRRGPA